MAFGIITMRKISGNLRGIQSHIYRQHESRTNPDICRDRSMENYSITDDNRDENVENFVRSRIDALPPKLTKDGKKKAIRKNAVRLCDFVATVSPEVMQDWTKEQRDGYFRDCLYWLAKRYGWDNIAYAQVHMDEGNPHIHVGVIPIRNNELNCKALFNPKEMKGLQEGFYQDIGSYYGLDQPEGGRRGLETIRFKAEQARKQLGLYEGAPKHIQGYLRGAISSCIENDLKGEKGRARAAEASLRYIKNHGDESWRDDWEYLTELDKDEKKLRQSLRDDY